MELKKAKEIAEFRRPVIISGVNSCDPSEQILCRRIAAVCFVMPERGGGFWVAECIGQLRNTVYRVRIENVKEA
jgi:hypothetical protein